MDTLEGLNEAQRRAVEAPDGPVMIVAGPGTGKTKTLVARIAWLLETGRAAPEEILALTFTNKAAAEMRERLQGVLGANAGVRVGTFHAVGLEALGADARTFVTEAERLWIIRELPRPAGLEGLAARELALRISRYKNGGAGQDDEAVRRLAKSYDAALAERSLRDFDDVLTAWRDGLVNDGAKAAWRYVLIDEFQDTSPVQYEIARLLEAHLFVIGDPWQSIYGFRGAGVGMFDQFAADFPAHVAVKLEVNYRSQAAIVRLANEIRGGDPLVGFWTQPGRARIIETLSAASEAELVLGEIERLLGGTDLGRVDGALEDGQYRFSDIAVIYRTHRAARAMVRRLAASGLPYQVVGGDGPYGQAPVRKVIEVLRAVGGDAATEPAGLSNLEVEQLVVAAPADVAPSELVGWVAAALGIDDEDNRLALLGLVAALVRFDAEPDGRARAARYLAQLEDHEFYDPAAEAITLLTIHAAKGLEFPVVFVIGAHEGGLPHLRADGQNDLDEERRLFYVAVTRARERLEVVHARERDGQKVAASRFLDGLSAERLVDPMMARLSRKRATNRAKRAQGTLF